MFAVFVRVYSFSGSDHHLIVDHFYARGICADSPPHRIISVRNFQKVDKDKLDEIFMCDDIWDDVLSCFNNVSDCLECFNLIVNGLLNLIVPLKNLRVQQRDCPWLPLLEHVVCVILLKGRLEIWVFFRLVIV